MSLDVAMKAHLAAAIPCQRALQFSREGHDPAAKGADHCSRALPGHADEHGKPGHAVDERCKVRAMIARQQVTFPVAWLRSVVCRGRPFRDRRAVRYGTMLPASFSGFLSAPPYPLTAAQSGQMVSSERLVGPHVQALVDGLMRHPHRVAVGVRSAQPARDLLRRPVCKEPVGHRCAKTRVQRQLAGLGTTRAPLAGFLAAMRIVAPAPTVALDLAADGRSSSSSRSACDSAAPRSLRHPETSSGDQ